MRLRVITTTQPHRPAEWLRECMQSVAASLPDGAEHFVVLSPSDPQGWMAASWDAAHKTDLVAFVDDDDIVAPGAMQACVDALQATGAAMAFTDEDEVDESGQFLRAGMMGRRTLRDIGMHPRSAHHLAVFRRDVVPDEVFGVAKREGIGLDWLMRASAAMLGGAVHVPMVGYHWRRHGTQFSKVTHAEPYARAIPALRRYLRGLMQFDRVIKQYRKELE